MNSSAREDPRISELLREALRAQEILAEQFDVSADVWSATSYKLLRGDALRTKRWNMLHPTAPQKKSYLESILQDEEGVFIAVSDYMRAVPDQIARWVPECFGTGDEIKTGVQLYAVDDEVVWVP